MWATPHTKKICFVSGVPGLFGEKDKNLKCSISVCMCYKIINGSVELTRNGFFGFSAFLEQGHNLKLTRQHCNANVRKNMFCNPVVNK